MDHAHFPWRPLGTLLVEDDLLAAAELELALDEQQRTGRLLGQILVAQGQVSPVDLARALARQHGVELASPTQPAGRPGLVEAPERRWRPLGSLLLSKGVLAEPALRGALAVQREHPERRLGELLVDGGHLSGATLAAVLAEQHGVGVEPQKLDVEAVTVPVAVGQPTYEVCAVAYGAGDPQRTVLYRGPNLLDAADFACEYVDREYPDAVEIERRAGLERETVWTYSRDRAAAEASSSKSLVETFGFDPTRWGVGS